MPYCLTELLNKVIHKEDKNEKLFLELKKMIILFEHESFNSVFGIFFLKEILFILVYNQSIITVIKILILIYQMVNFLRFKTTH